MDSKRYEAFNRILSEEEEFDKEALFRATKDLVTDHSESLFSPGFLTLFIEDSPDWCDQYKTFTREVRVSHD